MTPALAEMESVNEYRFNMLVDKEYKVIEGIDLSALSPRPHHILIRWHGRSETKGGIIIPQDRERMGRMNGEVLLVGPKCDPRIKPGSIVQFSQFSEKEFLGPQSPDGRDPVFFMLEENVFGILTRTGDGFTPTIEMLNGCVLTRPELQPKEKGGLIVVDREATQSFSIWAEVVAVDKEANVEFNVGDSVLYPQNMAEDFRLGDFTSEVLNVVRCGYGGKEIEAMRERENV